MNKSEVQAGVLTAVICALILLIMFTCGMSLSQEQLEEGVMISFGETLDGFGEPTPSEVQTPSAPPVSNPDKPTQSLLTQQDESIALEQAKQQKLKEQQRLEEQQRIQQERAAEQKRIAEQQERDRQAQTAKNLASGAFANKTGAGSGTSTSESMQGNPAGRGQQGGHSWSLDGRDILGKIVEPPYVSDQEGTLVINIRVDGNGNVTSASIGTGTNITDERLRLATIEAAKKTKFSRGNGIAIGTITYKFRQK